MRDGVFSERRSAHSRLSNEDRVQKPSPELAPRARLILSVLTLPSAPPPRFRLRGGAVPARVRLLRTRL